MAGEFAELPVPVVAVLGNHDYHAGHASELTMTLRNHGITVLDGDGTRVDISGTSVGIAGIKGFGGGFAGRCGSSFGEPEMKAFVGHTMSQANRLACALRELDTDLRIALLHYAPIPETLGGEPLEIYPFWALTYSGGDRPSRRRCCFTRARPRRYREGTHTWRCRCTQCGAAGIAFGLCGIRAAQPHGTRRTGRKRADAGCLVKEDRDEFP